ASRDSAPCEPHVSSLHDALPIWKEGIVGSSHRFLRGGRQLHPRDPLCGPRKAVGGDGRSGGGCQPCDLLLPSVTADHGDLAMGRSEEHTSELKSRENLV